MINSFNKNMKISLGILIALDAVMIFWPPADKLQKFGAVNLCVSFVSSAALEWFLVYLLTKMAVPLSQQGPDSVGYPIWSYIWRTFLVKASATLVFLVLIVSFMNGAVTPSIVTTLLSTLITLIVSIPLIWLFFSSNRRAQYQWAAEIARRMF